MMSTEVTTLLDQIKNRLLSLQIQLDYVTDHADLETNGDYNPYFLITYRYLCHHLPQLQAKFNCIKPKGMVVSDADASLTLQNDLMELHEILLYNYTPRINTLLAELKCLQQKTLSIP